VTWPALLRAVLVTLLMAGSIQAPTPGPALAADAPAGTDEAAESGEPAPSREDAEAPPPDES